MNYQAIFMPRWLRFVLITTIVISIFFRLGNIDRKVYWHDEVFTSLMISGYALDEVDRKISDGAIISVADLQQYQHSNPDRGLDSTVKSLAIEDSQLPPFYFVMVKLWVNLFGDSVTAIRALSVIFGLLVLPIIYWLSLELFQSSAVAWIATALIAISPFQILCGQEARMYSLHAVNILLSSTMLLRAIRLPTKLNWILYTTTIIIGIYTHLLFSLVLAAHGAYILINYGFKPKKILAQYVIYSGVGLLFFIPWILVIKSQISVINSKLDWLTEDTSLFKTIIKWGVNFSRTVIDLRADLNLDRPLDYLYWLTVSGLPLLLAIYAFYVLYRNSTKKEFSFILLLIFIPAIALALPDLLSGGSRSTQIRYGIPTYLGCNLAFAYLFARKIVMERNNSNHKQQILWSILLITLMLVGITSAAVSFPQSAWWNKYFSSDNIPIANIIEQKKSSLLVCSNCTTGMGFGNLVSLSYYLDDRTKIQLFKQLNLAKIPHQIENIFLFNPSPTLQKEIKSQSKIKFENLYQNNLSLWQLKR